MNAARGAARRARRGAWCIAGAVACVLTLPQPGDAQTRTLTQRQLRSIVSDTTLAVSVITPRTGQVEAADTAPVRFDASQVIGVRTGLEVERVRTVPDLAAPPSVRPPADPQPGQPAPPPPAAEDEGVPPAGTSQAGSATYNLPFRYITQLPGNAALVALQPVVEAMPLRYDAAAGVLRGRFLLGLHDAASPRSARPLGTTVRFQLISGADSLAPTVLELTRTSIPYQEIAIASRQDADSLHVRIIPEFDHTGVDLWLAASPWLELVSAAPAIAGLGVQSTAVTVRLRGGGGDRYNIALSSDRGTLEPSQLQLAPGEAATVRLRSAGIGMASISASGSGIGRAAVDVGFGWPLLFGLAAVFGGAVGGIASGLYSRGERRDAAVLAHVKLGIVSGLMAAVAYFAIGLNLVGIAVEVGFFNEAAVFTIAMIAGAIGLPVLWALKKERPPQT